MEKPLVSIITVNYNQPEITCQFLESLRHISYPNTEVIVVDNASPDHDPGIIPERYPDTLFIRSKKNLGFAGGNNLGVRHARGKYLLFLNNDTEVEPGFLEPLVEKCENDPKVGAVSPKIKYFNQQDTIQFAGITEFHPITIRNTGLGYGAKDDGRFNSDAPTAFVHGAAMMIPMEVVRRVGLMAECYFLYYEEHDWATRIKQAGYSLWYVACSVVLHKESLSVGRMSPRRIYYMNRARLLYLRRNVKGFTFLAAILYQLFIAIPKNAIVYLLKGKTDYYLAYRRAVWWHLLHPFAAFIHEQPRLEEPVTLHDQHKTRNV